MSETMATSMGGERSRRPPRRAGERVDCNQTGRSGRGLGEQGGADRAAEIAERRDVHRGRVEVVEQVGEHRLADALRERRRRGGSPRPPPTTIASTSRTFCAEATPAPSASTRLVDQPRRELVAAPQRAVPDAARQPGAAALLHDLEEVGLLALLVRLARPALHRRAAGVGLHAPEPPAAAALAADAHDDVADLARRAAAGPRPAVEHDPAADAGAPEHAEQRPVGPAGAERELGVGGDLDVVAEVRARAERLLAARRRARTRPPSRAGCARS